MSADSSRSSSFSVFALVALLIVIFGGAGIAIVHVHRQMHQTARSRVDLERTLARADASILDRRGRIEQAKSLAVAEDRRVDSAGRGLSPVRADRVVRVPGGRPEAVVAYAVPGAGGATPR